jgi:transcription elongation factor GreA
MNAPPTTKIRSTTPSGYARPIAQPSRRGDWPMTREAWQRLVDEIERLRVDVFVLAGGANPDDGLVHVPVAQALRRLETLTAVLAGGQEVDDDGSVVIGRRASLREEDGTSFSFALVYPGDGDPANGWISADSPLGAAVLGARAGDVVEVAAPAGRRTVTVIAVE